MQKSAGTRNLECKQSAVPGHKTLLACAMLAMLAGNQAVADVIIDDSVTQITTDGSSILVDNVGGDSTLVEAGSILVVDQNGNSVVINPGSGIAVTDAAGSSYITADGTGSNIYGDLTVQGDIGTSGEPVGTVHSTDINNTGTITSDTVSATTTNSDTVNATTITSGTVSATTITGGTITGSLDAADHKITNVAAGTAGTDAVNYDQLSAVQNGYNSRYDELASQTNARYNYLDNRIDKVEEVANAGVASVAALAAIPAPAYGKRFSVGAGLGNYSSESAVAVGFRAALTESTSIAAGVSRNTASKTAANIGVGYSW